MAPRVRVRGHVRESHFASALLLSLWREAEIVGPSADDDDDSLKCWEMAGKTVKVSLIFMRRGEGVHIISMVWLQFA